MPPCIPTAASGPPPVPPRTPCLPLRIAWPRRRSGPPIRRSATPCRGDPRQVTAKPNTPMAAPKKNITAQEAVARLSKKRDVKITPQNEIQVLKPFSPKKVGDVGNGSWGLIDMLVRYYGFKLYYVGGFSSTPGGVSTAAWPPDPELIPRPPSPESPVPFRCPEALVP